MPELRIPESFALDQTSGACGMVGRSPVMLELYRRIERCARAGSAVLIEGETGAGKELVARGLHLLGPRAAGPFVAVNAATIPEPLFESEVFGHVKGAFSGAGESHRGLARAADRGTLFLDEVGDLRRLNQAKLLRFLDSGEVRPVGGVRTSKVDLRVVCATNRDLQAAVEERTFRADLLYRLRALLLRVPSLRERPGDLPRLIAYFLCQWCRRHGRSIRAVSAEAMERLLAYPWPGNVRELKQELEQAAFLAAGEVIGVEALTACAGSDAFGGAEPEAGDGPASLSDHRRQAERELIVGTLRRLGWNVSAAARVLAISRVGLSRKLKALGIRRPGTAAASRATVDTGLHAGYTL